MFRPGRDGPPVRGPHAPGRTIRTPVVAALLLAAASAACDLPTEPPRWITEWEILLAADTLRAGDFLPPGIRTSGEGFEVDSLAAVERVTLGEVCEVCTCIQGPLPPITLPPMDWRVPLPPGLLSATLVAGTAEVVLRNHLGFDLLSDGRGGVGELLARLVDTRDGRVLDSLRVSSPLPPGDSLRVSFPLTGIELQPGLVVRLTGSLPGSGRDTVKLDPASWMEVDVRIAGARTPAARVILGDPALRFPERTVELPEAVRTRLGREGARVVLGVEVESRVGVRGEVLLSVASTTQSLFAGGAALSTPLVLPRGSPDAPALVEKRFLLDPDPLTATGSVHLASRSRILGGRIVELTGAESLTYRVTLRVRMAAR